MKEHHEKWNRPDIYISQEGILEIYLKQRRLGIPTLDMLREGFEIYIAADACGDLSPEAHERAMQRAIQAGAVPITSSQYAYELQQDWARSETYEGMMDIQRAHSPYGIQIRFSKWALGEHASEGGAAK